MAKTVLLLAAVAVAIALVSAQYTPDWTSLDARPLPDWYDQSKIGIFIHWGVFSVPSWAPDGYADEWFWWYWQGSPTQSFQEFMDSNYAPGFSYADFAPMFTAELWNPQEWAQLFANSGAKYVVLTSKHHEGFTNWPSNHSWNWNSVTTGPHRDLVGDLTTAVRAQNLTMGLYHSMFEWFNPLYLADKANNFETNEFVTTKTFPELIEIVNKYQPDVIWSDGDWEAPDTYWNSTGFLAWLYNESPVKDTVVVNDRWGAGDPCVHGGYYTCTDRYNPGSLQNHKWENCMTLDASSWGYRRNAMITDYLTINQLISEITSTVACGGNILINIGPAHDGTIDPIMQERLLQMGAWLQINGEAIYYSSPWRAQNETAQGVWYTTADANVYALTLIWPENNQLRLNIPVVFGNTEVYMLGYPSALQWTGTPGQAGLTITIPPMSPDVLPSTVAWTFKLVNVQ